jgi:tetratricopeptide (TPR) repeat protein
MSILTEANVDRALRFAVRNQDDHLAAQLAVHYLGRSVDDQFRDALDLLNQILAYERRPDGKYWEMDLEVALARAFRARADYSWPLCLENTELGLKLAGLLGSNADVLVELFRLKGYALSRLYQPESAIRALEQAAAQSTSTEHQDAVRRELTDVIEFLNITTAAARQAEQLVSAAFSGELAAPAGQTPMPSVRGKLEEAGYWETELRNSLIRGDQARALEARHNIGRLMGLAGQTAQADALLRSVLASQARAGLPVGRTQYHLGLTWEIERRCGIVGASSGRARAKLPAALLRRGRH